MNLFLAIAERMAAALPPEQYDAEIVEMHHRQKVDAPSGTAVALGRAVARGRGTTLEAAGTESGRDGHTGARKTGTIGFAALRGGQVVGEHTLLFAAGLGAHRADPSQLRPPGLCDRARCAPRSGWQGRAPGPLRHEACARHGLTARLHAGVK